MKKTNKVLLIYTGGTIGMGKNPLTGALEPLDFNNVVANVPEFKYITSDIDTYQFNPPIDSSDMTPQLWAELVTIISTRYDDYDGFIILH
jgi:L-asparaginase